METNTAIETVHADLHQSIYNLYEIMKFVEQNKRFQEEVDKDLRGLFYHLYIKCKRNFQAINLLINSEALPNSYVESTVLLRVLTEGYMHMCYMMETEKETLLQEYEALSNNKLEKILNPDSPTYRVDIKNKEDEAYFEEAWRTVKSKDRKIPPHFMRMDLLAKKTKNEIYYNSVYSMLNKYVHFNPLTFLSYGTQDDRGTFTYNSFNSMPYLEARIIYHSINFQMLLLQKICKFLKIETAPQKVVEYFSDWEDFKLKNAEIIFDGSNDFI